MDEMKKTLFIKTAYADEALKASERQNGAGYETYLCRRNYEDLLELIEQSGWYEEYRSFKIMAALCYAERQNSKQLPLAV